MEIKLVSINGVAPASPQEQFKAALMESYKEGGADMVESMIEAFQAFTKMGVTTIPTEQVIEFIKQAR